MATSDVAICNLALAKVGGESITSLSDSNKRANLCNIIYPAARDRLLLAHRWNFAIKRKQLAKDTATFTDGDVTTGTDNINIASHGKITGQRLSLSSTGTLPTGLETETDYYVIKVDDDNLKLASSFDNASAGTAVDITAAAAGGTHTVTYKPAFNYEYQFVLPSDYLRIISMDYGDLEFKVEDNYLISNESTAKVIYIAQITDTTIYTKMFEEALALTIAIELAYPLVQSNTLKQNLINELQVIVRDARSFDAQEGTPDSFEFDEWTNARLGNITPFSSTER